MNSVLRVNNVSKKAKDFQILNKVSFELERGEIVGLIGPNVLCRIKRRGKKESRRIAGIVGP